jgi:predicted RNA-binding protein YlxR (DUF448 family)
MAQTQPVRQIRIPQRMCVACRGGAGKRELIRVVRSGAEVKVDSTGKMPGRGAYLHPVRACWQRALDQRLLQRALRTNLSPTDLRQLAAYAQTLPAEDLDGPAGQATGPDVDSAGP